MTTSTLRACSQKDLAEMARQGGVRGWHAMRKDQLVKALLSVAKSKAAESRSAKKTALPISRHAAARKPVPRAKPRIVAATTLPRRPAPTTIKPANPRVVKHLRRVQSKLEQSKNLAASQIISKTNGHVKDRVVVMVRDSFWLHIYWELSRQSIERARAAVNQDWHTARPILRLMEVSDGGTTSASERIVKDVEIHGGVNNWYLHLDSHRRSFRVEIGYLTAGSRFFTLARSNVVTMPAPGSCDAVDEHWTDVANNFDKIFAMSGGYSSDGSSTELQELFEERLRRPMGSPMVTRYGSGLEGLLPVSKDMDFSVDAEMIVYGSAPPNAHVSLRGEPVRLRSDGTFMVRMSLPNQRQVIPLIACAADGAQQQTVVLAVERNTKVMEMISREPSE